MRQIIGLSGLKGSGKSTVALWLESIYDFHIVAYADPLKDALELVFGLTHEQLRGDAKEIIDERWGLTPRFMMQRFGTEVIRSIHSNAWNIIMERRLSNMPETNVVIEDVRYDNEIKQIQGMGGIIWQIRSTRVEEADMHSSEDVPLYYDNIILNNSTIGGLHTSLASHFGNVRG